MGVQATQLWLPALARFDRTPPLHRLLSQADRLADDPRSRLARLADAFHADAATLPVAALIREQLAGDAGEVIWLNADPAWVQPDMTGVRLLACGSMPLEMDEAQAFAQVLQPAFTELGLQLEISVPGCWQLRLAPDVHLPDFATPEQALGEDLYQHLPQGAEGRPWRVLLNEVQVLLHQHPLNAARQSRGLPPINSVWLWGAGRLPASLQSGFAGVVGSDVLLLALASRAGISSQARTPETVAAAQAGWLVDLQDLPATEFGDAWWSAVQTLAQRQPLHIAFASGERWSWRPLHRWRFWRRAPR
ncbi:phosphoglycerate mutase [Rhodanobacter sp. DHB23]|uniref:phosphoglycerate mutase n=1 Tax=Rhodanobacter sp. DHB23 TaxID=2775923 RepID=UPI0017815588|nr:phosphoglycerate mutase [Rhodanobacter sp. DHB23]MBD8873592.1 phosphoglycerate mutase [Rhodanobacter sp. DHB23]